MAQVEIERDGAVMIVTLNRPHRKNAMTLTMFAQLADAWEEVTADDDIRCVILTGAEGDFSSGMDLRALAGDVAEPDAIDTAARMKEDPGFIYRGLLKTYRPTKPVIAAVEGVAIAGGTEILQGTDIRIAARERALRCVGGALVALPDGRIRGATAPAGAVRGRSRHPAHRQAHQRRRGAALRPGELRRARRHRARQGARGRGARSPPTARSRWRPSCRRCAPPST